MKCGVSTINPQNFMFFTNIWTQYVSNLRKHPLKLSNLIFYDCKLKTDVPMRHKTENFFSPKSMFFTFCSFNIGWNPLIFLTFLLENGGSMATFGSRTSTAACTIAWGLSNVVRHASKFFQKKFLNLMDVLIFWQRPLTEPIVFFALKTDPTYPSTAYKTGWKRSNVAFPQ